MSAQRSRKNQSKPNSGHWRTVDTDTVLTNGDVENLTRTGVAAKNIVALVDRNACRFDMSAAGVIQLKQAGVTDDVIYAMLTNLDQCEAKDEGRHTTAEEHIVELTAVPAINTGLAAGVTSGPNPVP